MQTAHCCKFFLWYDPPLPEYTKNTISKLLRELRKAEGDNKEMRIEIQRLRKKAQMLMLALIGGCILLMAVWVHNARRKPVALGLKMLHYK